MNLSRGSPGVISLTWSGTSLRETLLSHGRRSIPPSPLAHLPFFVLGRRNTFRVHAAYRMSMLYPLSVCLPSCYPETQKPGTESPQCPAPSEQRGVWFPRRHARSMVCYRPLAQAEPYPTHSPGSRCLHRCRVSAQWDAHVAASKLPVVLDVHRHSWSHAVRVEKLVAGHLFDLLVLRHLPLDDGC